MLSLARNGYSADEVRDALLMKTGAGLIDFRYEIVNTSGKATGELPDVLSGQIDFDWSATVQRKMSLSLMDNPDLNFDNMRVKAYIRIGMPDGGWAEFPQGVFFVSSPTRASDAGEQVTRPIDCMDLVQIWADDLFTTRYSVAAGTKYTTAVSTILGSVPKNITDSSKTLTTALEAVPGDSKLSFMNKLLAAINYNPLHTDPDGLFVVQPYVEPPYRAEEFDYADDELSVISAEATQTLDVSNVKNVFTRYVSDPDKPYLISTYVNNNPASRTSVVRLGRRNVDYAQEENAADQATLDAIVRKLAYQATVVDEMIDFKTAIMPMHEGNDCFHIKHGILGIDAKYIGQKYSIPLTDSGMMSHTAKRQVTL